MSSKDSDRITAAQQTLDTLFDISQLLNTQLDKETLATCVGMIESGVNPEALARTLCQLDHFLRLNALHLLHLLHHLLHTNGGFDHRNDVGASLFTPHVVLDHLTHRPMQPSQLEIQREVEALRDIRRRSTSQGGPGALILDPDLPTPSSPPSPTASYWSAASATQQLNDGDSSSGSHEDSSSSEERATSSDDPFHLFWVPARLHPEIAPAEFRALLKEHARTPPPDGSNTNTLGRSLTVSSTGLERKRSMLSRQYMPPETDDIEEETIVPIRRNRTVLAYAGPQLTISDLQRLEELAEEATKDGDPSKLRTALRRSLSLNVSPTAIDTMDDIPPMPDEADAPIIVPPPGLILRRAARTKIRKASIPAGEGRGFSGRWRRPTATVTEQRTSSDLSSNDHTSEQGDSTEQFRRPRTFSNESITSDEQSPHRSDPYSEETSIYDSYVREDPESEIARSIQSLVAPQTPLLSLTLAAEDPKLSSAEVASEPPPVYPAPEPELQHPQPQRLNLAAPIEETPRTPSPDTTLVSATEETAVASTIVDVPVSTEKSASPGRKKEKDRKGLFSKWGSIDKNGKKAAKAERDREKETQRAEKEKEKEKEKESGFFGSLFSSKKRQDDSSSQTSGHAGSGREAATALLGASKSSKGLPTSPSPQPGLQGPYARYPIHVERAIYRLSHIKLANPRRPLYEQVLISNLMFWYLGVINKTQNPTPAAPPNQGAMGAAPVQPVSEQEEAQRREAEDLQRAENERLEREKQEREREQKERERELQQQQQQQKEKSRRGTLTKANPTQQARRAGEMLVKGPQYSMQHRVMEQEYHGPAYGYGSPSQSPGAAAAPRIHRQSSPPVNQPQSIVEPESSAYMYPGDMDPHLPLGVVLPTPDSLPASSTAGLRTRPSSSSSPPPTNGPFQADSPPQPVATHRSRSPPPPNHNRYSPSQPSRGPTRSLSATPNSGVPLPADGKTRKAVSAHAVVPSPNGRPRASIGSARMSKAEEEDVPLAVYQQRRRR
ncbi:hypothetical protein EV363DRAFT_1468092 [Boletus edulis]|nr:hypothetical protein EV363DRAFT_1468092 [Boletus edulis]